MTPDPIEFEDIDGLAAGAVGVPGARAFYIQARSGGAQLTVLVEKEQIAILAREALAFLERLDADYPVETEALLIDAAVVREPTVPLFRARVIGLGYDPTRQRVIIELRENSDDDDDDDDIDDEDDVETDEFNADLDEEGFVARVYATREQVKVMARAGAEAVTHGRPDCPLCGMPMGPERHICPRLN
jgi:uncharacterized repeat protein (TIGR03847 family)